MTESRVLLHPQVILSIADHYVRCTVQNKDINRVIGLVLGVQTGQTLNLTHCIEISQKTAKLEVENEQFNTDMELFKKLFPSHELLGWYATGVQPSAEDMQFHINVIKKWNESPIYLMLDPNASSDAQNLPVACFELEWDSHSYRFLQIPFKLESEEV